MNNEIRNVFEISSPDTFILLRKPRVSIFFYERVIEKMGISMEYTFYLIELPLR